MHGNTGNIWIQAARDPGPKRYGGWIVLAGILFVFTLAVTPGQVRADWLPFTLEGGHIVIDIELAGQPAKAVLDSGAERNAINRRFVEEYGQDFNRSGQIRMQGVNAVENVPLYSNIPLSLYGSTFTLNRVPAVFLGRTDLLIGRGFFRSFIVQIDYPNSRLRFIDRKAVDLKEHANVMMKQAGDSVLPAVQVSVEGHKVWLLFDTGNAGGVVLKRSFALSKEIFDEDTDSEQGIASGINKVATYEHFRLGSVGVGPYELENVRASIPVEGQSAQLGMRSWASTGTRLRRGVETEGLIGYDVLKHFLVTIDYDRYRVHLYAP